MLGLWEKVSTAASSSQITVAGDYSPAEACLPRLANCLLIQLYAINPPPHSDNLSFWTIGACPSECMAHPIAVFLYFFIPWHSSLVSSKARQDLARGA